MLREILISEIKRVFNGWELKIDSDNNPIVRFPSVQKEVGDVLIYDDGSEATIYVENISHGHFNPYDESLSDTERDKVISEGVIDFLQALFADKVLLYTTPNRRIGGWSRLDVRDGPIELSQDRKYYLWSRPYRP